MQHRNPKTTQKHDIQSGF